MNTAIKRSFATAQASQRLVKGLTSEAEKLAVRIAAWAKAPGLPARRHSVLPLTGAAAGIGLSMGVAGMYLLDPEKGAERRSLLQRQVLGRMQQWMAKAGTVFRFGSAADTYLADRVCTVVAQISKHSGAIKIEAQHGRITLHGEIPADEIQRVLNCVASVQGVREVCNDLNEDPSMAGSPAHAVPITRMVH